MTKFTNSAGTVAQRQLKVPGPTILYVPSYVASSVLTQRGVEKMRENSLLANTSRSQTLLPNIAEKLGPMCGLFHFIVQYKLIRDSAQSNTPWGQTKALSFADINFGF